MNAHLSSFKTTLFSLFFLLIAAAGWGQTNPTAQSLPYTQNFTSFTGSTTTYPAGFQGWDVAGSLNENYVTVGPSANRDLTSGNNNTQSRGIYDMAGKVGISSTGSALSTVVLAVNTTGKTNITLRFKAGTQYSSGRINELGVQYRVGTSSTFTNLTGATYQNTGATNTGLVTTSIDNQTISVVLPVTLENKAVVQLRWMIKDVSGTGNRSNFSIDDISIASVATVPTITATPDGPLNFSTILGTASATQNITVIGSALTPNSGTYYATAALQSYNGGTTEYFEFSIDDGLTYGNIKDLPISSGILNSTFKVRLKANAPLGSYTDKVLFSYTQIAPAYTFSKEIILNGTVTAQSKPVVTTATVSGTFGNLLNYTILATNSPTSYAITSGTLPTGLTLNTTTGVISGTPTVATTDPILVTVTATNAGGTSAPATLTFNIAKKNQTITFAALTNKIYGSADFALTGTATSSLGITYTSSSPSVATISGNTVTIVGVGTTQITASQAGNANYAAAADVARSFSVTAKGVTITGLTANNKVEDGTKVATLSGNPILNGVIAADTSAVTLSNTSTATFATATPATGIAVTVTGYILEGAKSGNYTLSQPSGLTANITSLGVPVATAATPIGVKSFTANWNAVPSASNYQLDVYTSTSSVPATTTTETFTTIGGGTPSSYLTRTWFGDGGIAWNAYHARTDREIVTGSGNPAITLNNADGAKIESGIIQNGITSISFDIKLAFTGTKDIVTIKVLSGAGFATITTVGTHIYKTDASSYSSSITGVTGDYKIVIENGSQERVIIDNLKFTSAGSTSTAYVAGYENLNVGNVLSYQVTGLTPATQYYYRVRAVSGTVTSPNSDEIELTTFPLTTTTYNGTVANDWDFGVPTATIKAVINGDFTTTLTDPIGPLTNLVSKTLTINSGNTLTIATGTSFTTGNFNNNGTLVVESDGNFVQTLGSTNTGVGLATVNRASNIKRLDYVYWSSPVADQVFTVFSPQTVLTRFLTYNEGIDKFTPVTPIEGATFAAAKGYAVRAPNNQTSAEAGAPFLGIFTGVPNNGNVPYLLEKSTLGNGFNLVGNPYPSNINLSGPNGLFTLNLGKTTGTAYFWTNVNKNVSAPEGQTYNQANYALYNESGSNGAQNSLVIPTGVVKVGQAFIVQTDLAQTINFTNSMRDATSTSIFFDRKAEDTKDRFWLKLTTPANDFNTMLIAYVDNATNEFEINYDASLLGMSSDAFFSVLNDRQLGIQGRQYPLNTKDVVVIGSNHYIAGDYVISVQKSEGIFANGQNIYLKDKQINILTNLSAESYTFAGNAGLTEGRFEIVYENDIVLGTGNSKTDELIVYRNGTDFIVKSATKKISDVVVYDTSGRLILKLNPNKTEIKIDGSAMGNGVYLLKVNRNGEVITKKIIK